MRLHLAAGLIVALAASMFFAPPIARADDGEGSIDTRSVLHDAVADAPPDVRAFYKARDFEPAWTGNERALNHGEEARQLLSHAEAQGLDSASYAAWRK